MSAFDAVARTASYTNENVTPASTIGRRLIAQMIASWKWIEQKRVHQTASRRLRVAETVSLGDKRFVSIIEVDGANYLIGGAAGSVSLLTALEKTPDFKEALRRGSLSVTEQA